MGKQITTYLRGPLVDAYEKALEGEGQSSYQLLTQAVREFLALRGYIAPAPRKVAVVGPEKEVYERELDRQADFVIRDKALLRRIEEKLRVEQEGVSKVGLRRRRRLAR